MAGSWTSLVNQPNFNTSTMILLTDGRVMVQEESTQHWHALTPDSTGSYINGTWSTLSDMSFWRRYYSSGVLDDGRVFICGGEQSGDTGDSNKGEIYDPVSDAWTPISLPPWDTIGDGASCVLPDGKIMIGALLSGDCIIYDPAADTWSTTGGQSGRTNEETWILLPDNTIVAPQCFAPFGSQKYIISTGAWQDEGALPVTIVDPVMSEIGPGMLLYNGNVIFFGAANSGNSGKTVLYAVPASPTGIGTWTAGPDIPLIGGQVIVCNDCPASLMPNGKVLFAAANFVDNGWGSPVLFFEYDPSSNSIIQAPTPPNNATYPHSNEPGLYWSRMVLLPSGQVLFSASSNNVQCYSPDGAPQESWRPTIVSVTQSGPVEQLLKGTQLNGLSQANIYGDDCYASTNYPLVQLTNPSTGGVFYCRTYAFSTMSVATGTSLQSARFSTAGIPLGTYELRVVANGISSHSVVLTTTRKAPYLDIPLKLEFEYFGKLVSEGDPFNWINKVIDPEIDQLVTRIKLLENSVLRLTSLIQTGELPQVGKEVAKEAAAADRKHQSKPKHK